jgi:hypothetical protein
VFAHSSGPLCVVVGGGLLSGCLQLADFVAVSGNGRLPLRAAIDETGVSNQTLQRRNPVSLGCGRERGDAGGLAGFNPCLPQGPCEALAANVGKLDRGEIVGLAEDYPGPAHCIGLNCLFHLGGTGYNNWFCYFINRNPINHNRRLRSMGLLHIISSIAIYIEGLTDMLTTGNQLKAARMLAGISQIELAAAAKISVTTVSAMEGKGAAVLGSGLDTIKAVMDALDAAGVEILNHGQPGVRLKAK